MRDSAKKKERGRNEETKRGGEREKEREGGRKRKKRKITVSIGCCVWDGSAQLAITCLLFIYRSNVWIFCFEQNEKLSLLEKILN